jgi:hypothetical protein
MLESIDGNERTASTAELFRRGRTVVSELEKAGAKPIAALRPTRLDVIYSLIAGLKPGAYMADSFGLHLESEVKQDEVVHIGERYGFTLPETETLRHGSAPTCYVELKPGRELVSVLQDLLSNEPMVITINLNYYER